MGLRKDLIDLRQGVPFDERQHSYFAVQYQFERTWIVFRQTTPVAERTGVERHQVGQANLDLVHRETDDCQAGTKGQQPECSHLSGSCTGTLEDLPLRLAQAVVLRELPDGIADVPAQYFRGVDHHAGAVVHASWSSFA